MSEEALCPGAKPEKSQGEESEQRGVWGKVTYCSIKRLCSQHLPGYKRKDHTAPSPVSNR